MSVTIWKLDSAKLLMVFFLITGIATPTGGSMPRKLDDTTVPAPPDSGVKCGCSGCNIPCYQSPPPPPPPTPKKPPTQYCPPPPSSGFVYAYGPPGSLYPIDPFNSGSCRSIALGLPLLIGCGLAPLLAFW
ncbi:hypothetical protein U1Q18_029644 [Sarracenia purpurea var. burkii]